jgi:LysM repeat protein
VAEHEPQIPAPAPSPAIPERAPPLAAGFERRAEVVYSLQRTAGNRSVTRMIEQSFAPGHTLGQPLLQRYESGEHAQFGARQGEAEEKSTVNKVEMTYGEMIAMADLFATPQDMRKAPEAELKTLLELIRRQRDKGVGSVSENEWITATGGRYTELASKNVAHFAPATSGGGFDAGGESYRKQWWTLHKEALKLAQAGKKDEALQTNAFADHFLTDAFSAGHLINKKTVADRGKNALDDSATRETFERAVAAGILADPLGATLFAYEANPGAFSRWAAMSTDSLAKVIDRIRYWKSDYFYSLFVKAVHDELNTAIAKGSDKGVEVENSKGKTWRLSGDKTLDKSPETLEFAREAVAQSRANLTAAAGQKTIDEKKLAEEVWAWVPQPTKAGQTQVKTATESLTDPADAASVNAWVAIIVEPVNFDAVRSELLKEGLLRLRTPAPDAGTPDAGTPDAGTGDAGVPDAGTPSDAGVAVTAPPATVTVAAGDSLWRIAARKLGKSASASAIQRYQKLIYDTNRATIGADPDLIHPGMVLQLPPLS